MTRLPPLLRRWSVPALALASVALLAWSVGGWWTFHRDLYLEEEHALQALADETGFVRYRRAGEVERLGHRRHATDWPPAPEDVAWSVPFVGRVEYVDVPPPEPWDALMGRRSTASRDVRERIAALPGLRGFRGIAPDAGRAFADYDPWEALLKELPEPDEPKLSALDTEFPFPRGEALEGDAKQETARRIAAAWTAEPRDRPLLVRIASPELKRSSLSGEFLFSRGSEEFVDFVELTDGDRRLQYGNRLRAEWPSLHATATLSTGDELREWDYDDGGSRLTRYLKGDLSEARETPPPYDPRAVGLPRTLNLHAYRLETIPPPDELLGDDGERIVRVERLDDGRLYLETEGAAEDATNAVEPESWTLRAIVLPDLGFARERWELKRDAWRTSEVRRVALVDGEPMVEEFVRDTETSSDDANYANAFVRSSEHRRVAVAFDPAYDARAFDPRTYGGPVVEFRDLPVYRSYYVAGAFGLAGLCLAGIAAIAQALGGRRAGRPSASSDRRPSRFRIRFGLASVFGMMLLAIGASGWIKNSFDETQADLALVRELVALANDRVDYARREPAFPWTLFATDAFPIGSPLESVRLYEAPSPDLQRRLLERSPAVDYLFLEPRSDRRLVDPREVESWIGRPLPDFEPEPEWDDLGPLPHGERLDDAEAAKSVAEALEAWRQANESRPTRFIRRRSSTMRRQSQSLAIRDGERSWRLDSVLIGQSVEVSDGVFRRTFGRERDEWTLIERSTARRPAMDVSKPFDGPFGVLDFPASEDVDAMLELPLAPNAMPPDARILRDPLDQALVNGERDVKVAVERIDDVRLRFDLSRTIGVVDQRERWSRRTSQWTLLVRTDLDWAAERCDAVETYGRWESPMPDGDPYAKPVLSLDDVPRFSRGDGSTKDANAFASTLVERHREVRCRNLLRRIGGHVFAVDSRLKGGDWRADEPPKWEYESYSDAIEVDPAIDERLFDRPALDAPAPVVPRGKSWLTWYAVAFALGVATLATGPLQALFARLRRPRRETTIADEEGGAR